MGSVLTVIVITPWMAFLFIPLVPAYEYVRRHFVMAAREVKRLDSLAASPIFSNFDETLQARTRPPSTLLPGTTPVQGDDVSINGITCLSSHITWPALIQLRYYWCYSSARYLDDSKRSCCHQAGASLAICMSQQPNLLVETMPDQSIRTYTELPCCQYTPFLLLDKSIPALKSFVFS